MARALRGVRSSAAAAVAAPIRCAIYTRKSTDEGLNRDFNSLDNQREAAEAYVQSQRHEGWEILPDRYDDGGFTGGNLDRPALQRLLTDIETARVDRIIVYKIDRLSRSLLDFAKLADFLEKHDCSIVSVTQQLDTSTSMGRLTLNMLLSFAQFEREMVSDRTRDKISAARRRGKWTGGTPRLGYDVAPEGGRLLVNREEAQQVRSVFRLYAENPSLVAVSQDLNRRGWRRKCWTKRDGGKREGGTWDVANLRRLLTDPTYIGKVKLNGDVYPGEHEGIVPKRLFDKVQAFMCENRRTGGASRRNTHGALLRGLLRCKACDSAMVHTWAKKGNRLYRYYTCSKAQKRGAVTCPTRSVSAEETENFVVDQIRVIGRNTDVRRATFKQAISQVDAQRRSLRVEAKRLKANVAVARTEVDRLVAAASKASGEASQALLDGLSKAQARFGTLEARFRAVCEQQAQLDSAQVDEKDLGRTLEQFDPIWEVLLTPEKERILQLLIERIDYHGKDGTLSFSFRLPGIVTLAAETATETGS